MNVNHQNKVAELVKLFASTLRIESERLYRSGMIWNILEKANIIIVKNVNLAIRSNY